MKAASFVLIICLISQTLTGCHAFNQWNVQQKHKAWENGKDFCGMRILEAFVGTAFDDIELEDHFPEEHRIRISDPRIIPPEGTDFVWTMDLRYERLHIYLDKDGNLQKMDCG